MKFLLIVLIIRFLAKLLMNGKKEVPEKVDTTTTARVPHPAEVELRMDYYRVQFW